MVMSYSRIDSPDPVAQQNNSRLPSSLRTLNMSKFSFQPTHPISKGAITKDRRKRLILSYLPDWLLTIFLAALFFSLEPVEGYRRHFSLNDTSLRYPFTEHERIPNLWLFIIAVIAPLLILPIINFITVRSWWDLHNSCLGLILGLSITGAFTQVVKVTVGRPRPDIISRCQPPAGLVDPPFGLTDWTVCTNTDHKIMRDGFRSFFSGHSSLSFAGLGFLAFYMAGKLHLFDSRGHAGKAWLSLSPFMAAALVAISRSMDYRHHWQDILVGSFVGTALAFFSYRQYYPPLESPLSHRPYSPRIAKDADGSSATLPSYNTQTGNGQEHHPMGITRVNLNGGTAGGGSHRRYMSNSTNASYDDLSSSEYRDRDRDRIAGGAGAGSGSGYGQSSSSGYRQHPAPPPPPANVIVPGTVPRPTAGSLERVWRQGSSSSEGEADPTTPFTAVPLTAVPGLGGGGQRGFEEVHPSMYPPHPHSHTHPNANVSPAQAEAEAYGGLQRQATQSQLAYRQLGESNANANANAPPTLHLPDPIVSPLEEAHASGPAAPSGGGGGGGGGRSSGSAHGSAHGHGHGHTRGGAVQQAVPVPLHATNPNLP